MTDLQKTAFIVFINIELLTALPGFTESYRLQRYNAHINMRDLRKVGSEKAMCGFQIFVYGQILFSLTFP